MGTIFGELWHDESGISTVEIVIIVAVLVGVALLFRNQITNFVRAATDKVFDPEMIDESLNMGEKMMGE